VSKRRASDLPGFKNLEGLYIACFSPNDSPPPDMCVLKTSPGRENDQFMFREVITDHILSRFFFPFEVAFADLQAL